MVVPARKQTSAEQLDQSLVRFTTPNEHAGAHAIAIRELDGDSMSHVFGRETEGTGNAIRTQVFQSDKANAHDGISLLLIDSQGLGQKALHYFGISPEVEQHAAGDHALD